MGASVSTLSLLAVSTMAGSWTYDGDEYSVDEWADLYPECGYERQSPIDLPIDESATCSGDALTLDWTATATNFAIHNNGHSLQAIPFYISGKGGSDVSGLEVLHHTNDTQVRLKNSFYNTYQSKVHQAYCFDSLHFHWAEDNEHGSEHTVNGQSFPLEVHLVHYSCDYRVAGTALKEYSSGLADYKYDDSNVLAVIGVLFEIGEANPAIDAMLDDMILNGIYKHEVHELEEHGHGDYDHDVLRFYYTPLDLQKLLPESREMVAYLGSLTTPPCYQTVRWHVMRERMTVSEAQMAKFRQLLTSENYNDTMAPNYRPVQPLHDRKIYYCQQDVEDDVVTKNGVENADESEKQVNMSTSDWQILAACGFALFVITALVCCVLLRRNLKRSAAVDTTERKLSNHVADSI